MKELEASPLRPPDAEAIPEETVRLLARFRCGDAAAGDEVFARYYDRVQRILRVRLMSRGAWRGELEDLLQETFLAAVRGIEDFRPRDSGGFVHWLTTIAERKLQDALRRAYALKRDRAREVSLAEIGLLEHSAPGWEPSDDTTRVPEKLARAEEVEAVDRCLARLEPHYREVILLRLFADSPWGFVAAELGCPSADAALHLFARARAALAAAMLREGHGG